MLWTFLQSFSFIPHTAQRRWFFYIFFTNLACRLPWQPINSAILTKFVCLVKDYPRNISVNFCQNICSGIAIKPYFHFSVYKSMETLSCHSIMHMSNGNKKNLLFVEANVVNISAKFQLHPPNGFRGDDFEFFFWQILNFSCHGNQSNSADWTQFIWLVENYSRNISVKLLSKYLQWYSNKCQFPLFTLLSQWQL